jgi:hypothetical protein
LKYEIITKQSKKGTKRVLMPKRISKRHQPLGLASFTNATFDSLKSINKPESCLETYSGLEMSFEYSPKEMEGLFDLDDKAIKVQQIAMQRSLKVSKNDIEEVIRSLNEDLVSHFK